MPFERRTDRGMTLIEIVIALFILSLIALLVASSSSILTRGGVGRVDDRARANNLASRYLEVARATIRVSSLIDLTDPAAVTETVGGKDYNIDVDYTAGRILTADLVVGGATYRAGTFYGGAGLPLVDGLPARNAAVHVTSTVTWLQGATSRSVAQACVLVPRLN